MVGARVVSDRAVSRWRGVAREGNGSELHPRRLRDVGAGKDRDDRVVGVSRGAGWASDNRTFFYTRHECAMRPYQLWRHALGTPATDDVLVHTEPDEAFFLVVERTKDGEMLLLGLGSKVTSESQFLRADTPTAEWQVV